MLKLLIYFSLFILWFSLAFSQSNPHACIDSTQIWPGYPCAADYSPVCCCDGNTYRNRDCALHLYGVQICSDGICEPMDFDVNPTLIDYSHPYLYLKLITRDKYDVNIQILDVFGKKYYDYTYSFYTYIGIANVPKEVPPINVISYEKGVYLIFGLTQGYFVVKKFVVIN